MNGKYESLIMDWMKNHRNEIVDDIKKIVNIKSVSDVNSDMRPFGQGCRDVLDKMLELGVGKELSTQNYEYYCGSIGLVSNTGNEKKGTIGVWTHLDVVPEGDGWTSDPYDTVEKDGFLIGRGVQDNKSPAIAALYALQCIKELQLPVRHDLKLFTGCSEECGMQDVEYFTKHYPCPELSLIADCGFPVCFAEKGLATLLLASGEMVDSDILSFTGGNAVNTIPNLAEIVLKKTKPVSEAVRRLDGNFTIQETEETVQITAHGISKHAAFPQGSVNAIKVLTEVLCQNNMVGGTDYEWVTFLNTVNQDDLGTGFGIACSDEISGELVCNGTVVFLEQQKIHLKVNLRYPVFSDYESMIGKIRQMAENFGYSVVEEQNLKPVYHSPESRLVKTLTDCYNRVTGQNTQPFAMSGATYSRKIPNAIPFGMAMPEKGIVNNPLFASGHGDYHQPDEGICIEQVVEAAAIYAIALLELDEWVQE